MLHHGAVIYQLKSPNRQAIAAENISWPGILLRSKSWDLMPTEIVRPVAMTSLGDIAVMARRLGMTWKTLDPERGVLAAEGRGHSSSSIEFKALGPTLRYLKDHDQQLVAILAGSGVHGPMRGQSKENSTSKYHLRALKLIC